MRGRPSRRPFSLITAIDFPCLRKRTVALGNDPPGLNHRPRSRTLKLNLLPIGVAHSKPGRALFTTKREILRSVLRFFPLKCGSTCHFQVATPCSLCDYQTLNTERPEHRRDLSVEASEARRPQRTSIWLRPTAAVGSINRREGP